MHHDTMGSVLVAVTMILTLSASAETDKAAAPAVTILTPAAGEPAYKIAGDTFADLWQKATGRRPGVATATAGKAALPEGDLILIGSDAVHPVVHDLIYAGAIDALGITYGGDDYRILTVHRDGRRYVIVAGGSGLSTIYAVYDFFRRQAGAEYFWDGDVIPHRDTIELAAIDIRERPRFEYRGLRYFAHRGLHRFQAEHWDLDDWKHEIDWLLKKRFNLFMLRTGIDDLFQRAFSDVPYPPTDAQDPDAKLRSYDDRTSFWPLKYRGELRKQVLQYARDRGLLHPEDTGTITHWYSHTPSAFYRNRPDFPVIRDQKTGYSLATQAIWDIEADPVWNAYWKLTETHIREFGSPRMFHTIGMAERTFGKDARDNLQRKLYVYRRTQQTLREHYPDAPMLVASWDFLWWKNEDVRRLLTEFDPHRTLILDYLADLPGRESYRDWDLFQKFPWIFGIFASYACNSDVHEDYGVLSPRLKTAAADSQCRGLVTWPEISHNDTFLLEYLADNSWNPQRLELAQATSRYCQTRYPAELAAAMQPLWTSFLAISQSFHWGHSSDPWEFQFRMLTGGRSSNLTPERLAALKADTDRMLPGLQQAPEMLRSVASLSESWYANEMWRRDAIDMARTVASRALRTSLALGGQRMEAWRLKKTEADRVRRLAQLSQDLLGALGDVLAMSDDFSMNASLARLASAKELGGVQPTVNPHAEQTLKGNAENDYCRSHHYELVEHVYRPELAAYWNWAIKRIDSEDRTAWRRPPEFTAQQKVIVDRFYDTPLAQMAPTTPRDPKHLADALTRMASLVQTLLNETQQ
jgi:hypothetical protein